MIETTCLGSPYVNPLLGHLTSQLSACTLLFIGFCGALCRLRQLLLFAVLQQRDRNTRIYSLRSLDLALHKTTAAHTQHPVRQPLYPRLLVHVLAAVSLPSHSFRSNRRPGAVHSSCVARKHEKELRSRRYLRLRRRLLQSRLPTLR